jgi:putative transposase
MTIPLRGSTSHSTYFITSQTWGRKYLLQSERMAQLTIEVLQQGRREHRYALHEFVIMPDHFHLLITPWITLERAMQVIKGRVAFRAHKEFGIQPPVWQKSFFDRRVRDAAEYERYRNYIHNNPVKKGLALTAVDFSYSSAHLRDADPVPQGLKPLVMSEPVIMYR